MRRVFNGLVVLSLVAVLTTPAYAAPRRDDGNGNGNRGTIQKIVQLVKRVVKVLDGGDVTWPKP